VIDLDAFERNLRRLPEQIAGRPVKARPHCSKLSAGGPKRGSSTTGSISRLD